MLDGSNHVDTRKEDSSIRYIGCLVYKGGIKVSGVSLDTTCLEYVEYVVDIRG